MEAVKANSYRVANLYLYDNQWSKVKLDRSERVDFNGLIALVVESQSIHLLH